MTFATYFNEKLNIFLVNLDFLAKYVGFAVVFYLVKLPKRGLFLLFLAVFGLLHGTGAAFYHAAALEHISNAMQKDFCIVQESDVSGILTVIAGFHINRQLIAAIDLGQTGQTLNQYLTEYRMEKAKQLLKDARFKISDISSRVGYSDGNYFGKSFKKYSGFSPSEYRERNTQ